MTGNQSEESGAYDPSITTDARSVRDSGFDLDGDGKVSPWESNLCRICLMAALAIAFGDKVISGMI